jgi:hypothetical protein
VRSIPTSKTIHPTKASATKSMIHFAFARIDRITIYRTCLKVVV